jgi:hypothetical protein
MVYLLYIALTSSGISGRSSGRNKSQMTMSALENLRALSRSNDSIAGDNEAATTTASATAWRHQAAAAASRGISGSRRAK